MISCPFCLPQGPKLSDFNDFMIKRENGRLRRANGQPPHEWFGADQCMQQVHLTNVRREDWSWVCLCELQLEQLSMSAEANVISGSQDMSSGS